MQIYSCMYVRMYIDRRIKHLPPGGGYSAINMPAVHSLYVNYKLIPKPTMARLVVFVCFP